MKITCGSLSSSWSLTKPSSCSYKTTKLCQPTWEGFNDMITMIKISIYLGNIVGQSFAEHHRVGPDIDAVIRSRGQVFPPGGISSRLAGQISDFSYSFSSDEYIYSYLERHYHLKFILMNIKINIIHFHIIIIGNSFSLGLHERHIQCVRDSLYVVPRGRPEWQAS